MRVAAPSRLSCSSRGSDRTELLRQRRHDAVKDYIYAGLICVFLRERLVRTVGGL